MNQQSYQSTLMRNVDQYSSSKSAFKNIESNILGPNKLIRKCHSQFMQVIETIGQYVTNYKTKYTILETRLEDIINQYQDIQNQYLQYEIDYNNGLNKREKQIQDIHLWRIHMNNSKSNQYKQVQFLQEQLNIMQTNYTNIIQKANNEFEIQKKLSYTLHIKLSQLEKQLGLK